MHLNGIQTRIILWYISFMIVKCWKSISLNKHFSNLYMIFENVLLFLWYSECVYAVIHCGMFYGKNEVKSLSVSLYFEWTAIFFRREIKYSFILYFYRFFVTLKAKKFLCFHINDLMGMRKNICSVLLALWYTFLRNNQSFLNTVFTAEFFRIFLLSFYACVIILVGLWRFLDKAKVSSPNISFHIFLLCMFNQIRNEFSTTRSEWPYLSNIFQMFLNDGTLKMNVI